MTTNLSVQGEMISISHVRGGAVRSANVNTLTVPKQYSMGGVFLSPSVHSVSQGKRGADTILGACFDLEFEILFSWHI